MKKEKSKPKLRSVVRWLLWIILAQFILLNISAALYAYKFTHLYTPPQDRNETGSKNFLVKTWRLFSGPRVFKSMESGNPSFFYTTDTLETRDKIPLEIWQSQADSASYGTVILFHGLTRNKSTVLHQATEFCNWGYNVVLVDARAHGNSGGQTTTIGYMESEEVKLAYDYVKNTGEKKIYLWGISMGAVQVLKAVADYALQPAGIILEMPFQSLQSHIKARINLMGFPKQPFGFLITFWIGAERGFNSFTFNTADYAKKINCPVLLEHASKDPLVPGEEAENIYAAIASADKKMVIYEDAGHESFLQKDPALWRKETGDFIKANR